MDIRDAIKHTIDTRDAGHTAGAGTLGDWIAADLEQYLGMIVDGDEVAQLIRQADGQHTLDSGELADALAETIEADLDEEE